MVFYYSHTDITNERMHEEPCVSSIVLNWMTGSSEQTGMQDLLKVGSTAEGGQADRYIHTLLNARRHCCGYVQVRDEYRTEYDEGRGGYSKSAIRMFERLGHPEYLQSQNRPM